MRLESRVKVFIKNNKNIEKTNSGFKTKKSKTTVKLPIKISEELLRLIGIIHGDGNMSFNRVHITDKSREYHEKLIIPTFEKLFGIRMNLFHDKNRNSYYSYTKNKIIYKFLVEILKIPSGSVRKNLRFPTYLKDINNKFKSSYIGGIFDAEGHVRKRQAEIDFSITNKEIWEFVKKFLNDIDVKFSTKIRKRRKNPEYEIYIYGKPNLINFNEHIKFSHPDKIDAFQKFLPVH